MTEEQDMKRVLNSDYALVQAVNQQIGALTTVLKVTAIIREELQFADSSAVVALQRVAEQVNRLGETQ